jgi:hypothetical protein
MRANPWAVVIRPVDAGDDGAVRRVARLDSAPPLSQPALLAEIDGQVRAAIGADGRVVADPFQRTADVVEILELRRAQLQSA